MDMMAKRRVGSGLLWLVLAATGCWSGGAAAQTSAGAIPDGRGRVVALAAGGYHTCALRSSGSVACWGSNWGGESTPPTKGYFTAVAAGLMLGLAGIGAAALPVTANCSMCWATR